MAKALILYFSQGGHTRQLAGRIRTRLEEQGINSEIVSVPGEKPAQLKDCRLVFIGTPLYYGREPLIWRDYIRGLPDLSGKAGFIFSTFGAEKEKNPDRFMNDNLALYFAEKGLKVLSSCGTTCEDTWTPMKKIGYGRGRPDEKALQEFDYFIDKAVSDFKTGKTDRAVYDFSIKLKKHFLMNRVLRTWIRLCPKPRIDNEKCKKCGVCVRSCPVNNIEEGGLIRIGPGCIKCLECERVCGSGAVKVNWKLMDMLMSGYGKDKNKEK